ncbi:MAG: DNA mismatch repair endonuclease MutL [Phycisphaerae bacterium]
MPVINVLSAHLVNKIAAGEVIERPASVVKELVENALDAGATRVDITVEQGGQKLIQVADDGCGMAKEDLQLAFVPHATSKISAEDDLFHIGTMGFRGEALASIASISHAHIRSRSRDSDDPTGYEIGASGDTFEPMKPCAAAAGTTISIRDLFFNTPARRKFMRRPATEFGHISEMLARVALPRPGVAFTLTHNGREVQNLPACESTRRRVSDLYGADLGDSLLKLQPRTGDVSVNGYIAPPGEARSSGKWQYFFLNGRYIRDRLLTHALREAFRGLVDPRKWPVAFIFIEIDPADVDVNVHPTKIEVRFRDSQRVHGELYASLKETLNRSNLTPGAQLDEAETDGLKQALDADADEKTDQSEEQRKQSLREALADFFKAQPKPEPRLSFPESSSSKQHNVVDVGREPREPSFPQTPLGQARPPRQDPLPNDRHSLDVRPTATDRRQVDQPSAPAELSPYKPPQRKLMQVHDSYIITETDEGMMIVDQHALHERVMYNEFMRRLSDGGLDAQRTLIPEPISVTAAEAALLEDQGKLLGRLGIEVEQFGPTSVAVQRFPMLLLERNVQPGRFLREFLDELSEDETTGSEKVLEGLLAMMACKAAVKAGDPLTPEEMDDLLTQRDTLEKASSCPHGRPTTILLSLKELEKQFKRI